MFDQFIAYCFANYTSYAIGSFFVSLAAVAYAYALLPNSMTLSWNNASTAFKVLNVIFWIVGVLAPVLNVIGFFGYIVMTLVYGLGSYTKYGQNVIQFDRDEISRLVMNK